MVETNPAYRPESKWFGRQKELCDRPVYAVAEQGETRSYSAKVNNPARFKQNLFFLLFHSVSLSTILLCNNTPYQSSSEECSAKHWGERSGQPHRKSVFALPQK